VEGIAKKRIYGIRMEVKKGGEGGTKTKEENEAKRGRFLGTKGK